MSQLRLAARSSVRVLLGDLARLAVSADGEELKRELVPGMDGLRPPDRSRRWQLAPILEFDPHFHRVHEIDAWIDGPLLPA
ncbi:hypothetical protein [Opitutus terrae]|uniref:hypothetical protein n=1 Tax=Opitutus terrae TaxID=107709 RepID=UPI0005D133B7|nr:hypothetical protein [Opitutus terrae]